MPEVGLPIRRWRVENFKSIERADLALAGLTVIVGANSSGKSSILQSILLAAQAAQARGTGSAYPLNGPLVQLGDYADVKSTFAPKSAPVRIGGVFDLTSSERWTADVRRRRLSASRHQGDDEQPYFVEWALDLHGQAQPGSAEMRAVTLEYRQQAEHTSRQPLFRLDAKKRRIASDSDLYRPDRIVGPVNAGIHLPFRYDIAGDVAAFWAGRVKGIRESKQDIDGVSLVAGFPSTYLTKSVENRELARVWLLRALGQLSAKERLQSTPVEDPQGAMKRLLDLAAKDISSWQKLPTSSDLRDFPFFLRQRLTPASDLPIFALRHFIGDMDFDQELVQRLGRGREVLVANLVPNDAYEQPIDLLGDRVSYLGPLRQDPEVVYRRTPPSRPRFLGTKGEFTAPALHALRNQHVSVPMPDLEQVQVVRLSEAMNAWVSFLEAATTIETRDKGRLGFELVVTQPHLAKPVDLTSVGVGVSQVVPVVLLCLLSEPGGVLLLEQPELHLHPAMQQRLADFFVRMARSGRQLVVETHSEYLVNRLRLRVAQDQTDATSALVSVINVSREKGRTHCEKVDVNRYGSIEQWPAGFFDQATTEAEDLLLAGLAKRSGRS
jgi:predicted ATPase